MIFEGCIYSTSSLPDLLTIKVGACQNSFSTEPAMLSVYHVYPYMWNIVLAHTHTHAINIYQCIHVVIHVLPFRYISAFDFFTCGPMTPGMSQFFLGGISSTGWSGCLAPRTWPSWSKLLPLTQELDILNQSWVHSWYGSIYLCIYIITYHMYISYIYINVM